MKGRIRTIIRGCLLTKSTIFFQSFPTYRHDENILEITPNKPQETRNIQGKDAWEEKVTKNEWVNLTQSDIQQIRSENDE